MKLTFTGFPPSIPWKAGKPASVVGYGPIEEGETCNFDENTAQFLLATKVFVPAEEESTDETSTPETAPVSPSTPESTPEEEI